MKLLLIQGANMEYLGRRQPELYGTTTAKELDALLRRRARALGVSLDILYTNTEGEAVSAIYKAERAGVEWQGVAYKAIGNAWSDLYAGAIQFMFVDLTAARGQVVAKKARPLAISLPERSKNYPDVPALAETYPGFESSSVQMLLAPAFFVIEEPVTDPAPVLTTGATL